MICIRLKKYCWHYLSFPKSILLLEPFSPLKRRRSTVLLDIAVSIAH